MTPHGSISTYSNHRCRCDLCREAQRRYSLAYKHRTGRTRPWDEYVASRGGRTHGLRSTYTHGCRCPDCREAERAYRRIYRARNP